jgi:DNA-binding MarR family transcriptional regulator/GNAT superfamily N-acetyltransferase
MKSNTTIDLELERQVAAVRRFSRFYTRKFGIIEPKLLDSPWTLQEARIIYEIAERQTCTATDLVRALGLDAGYLSRTLQTLQQRQIVARKPSKTDRRAAELALTAKGRAAFAELDGRSRSEVAGLLGKLDPASRAAAVAAMSTIEQTLEPPAQQPAGFLLRTHRPATSGGSSQGTAHCTRRNMAGTSALRRSPPRSRRSSYDASREHCWIAEIGGEPVGSVFLVQASGDVAKLRLLLVERKARGLGVGRALTEQCIRFAQAAGYMSITLWTQSTLVAARGIYQRAGFQRVKEEKHHSFGVDLVGETWELKL